MPFGLAYFSGHLRAQGLECKVIDAFGSKPNQCWQEGSLLFRGMTPNEVMPLIPRDSRVIFIYAINLSYHNALLKLIRATRAEFPQTPIVVLENTQAVTAYALQSVQDELHEQGADYVLTGEPEERGMELIELLNSGKTLATDLESFKKIDGLGFRYQGIKHFTKASRKIKDLDAIAFAAWDLFPYENYWKLGYSHGPLTTKSYLPLLTSRGCPYACRFCVIPQTNDLKWRARSAKNVVDEIEHHMKKYGVREFHIEDVDPTIDDRRTREICNEIIARKLDIIWKLCSGTKVETIKNEETIELMAKAGCRYISISPESGSAKVMKAINKPFNLNHSIKLIKKMNEVKIRSQACFVLGFPGEEDEDRKLSYEMAMNLTRQGLDEIAIFIITPVPGSAIYDQFHGFKDLSELNFSPTWRSDYQKLNEFRLKIYRDFLILKTRRFPGKIIRQSFNFLFRRFETKMEMTPFRALHTLFLKKGWIGSRIKFLEV